MKKNPLSEIYESKVLTSEAVPSNKVKGEKELDAKIDAKKAKPVAGQGPEAVKKDLETPEEMEGTKVLTGEPKVLTTDSVEKPSKAFEGSFEKLFKATINEDVMEDNAMEMDITVPTSDEEMVDEIEDKADEVNDLVSDLKDVMDKLQTILDKIGEENKEEDEVENELGDEESEVETEEEVKEESEDTEEVPFEEATELKPVGKAGHSLMGKDNKVGGAPKVHGGKAQGGDVESDPELKLAKAHDKALQNPKAKPEVKSTVKKGEFFK